MSNDPDLIDDPEPVICKTCDGEGAVVYEEDVNEEFTCPDCLGEGVADQ